MRNLLRNHNGKFQVVECSGLTGWATTVKFNVRLTAHILTQIGDEVCQDAKNLLQ